MPMPRKPRSNCIECLRQTQRPSYKYCSNQCQADYRYATFIQRWLRGEEIGLQRLGVVSRHIKRYLREKYDNKCVLCGWAELNPVTQQVPLVADHIDGDWKNNVELNLRLVCPNCDSLSPTYAGLNRGNGRKGRKVSNRVEQGRILVSEYAEVTQLVE